MGGNATVSIRAVRKRESDPRPRYGPMMCTTPPSPHSSLMDGSDDERLDEGGKREGYDDEKEGFPMLERLVWKLRHDDDDDADDGRRCIGVWYSMRGKRTKISTFVAPWVCLQGPKIQNMGMSPHIKVVILTSLFHQQSRCNRGKKIL